MSAVSVIVPARDAAGLIGPLLDALAAQRVEGGHEVVVVDNGSRDDTAAIAEASPACDRVVRRARGEGPGAARNAGVAASSGDAIAFTDADCRPAPGWLAAALARLRAGADVVAGRIEPEPGVAIGPYDRTLAVHDDHGLYPTANLVLRRELFERLGGFVDWTEHGARGRPFGEDTWLVWRARRAGARVAFAPGVLVHHAVFPAGPSEYLAEQRRVGEFASLVARVPELRDAFCHRRWFHSRRGAAFDLAAAGVALAVARRRPAAALAALPYLRLAVDDARRWGRRRAPAIAAVRLAGDALAAASLVRGSARARTLLL